METGRGWVPKDIIDFCNFDFYPGVADKFHQQRSILLGKYYPSRQTPLQTNTLKAEIRQVASRIVNSGSSSEDERKQEFILHWLALRIILQYSHDVWTNLYSSSYSFSGKVREKEGQLEDPDTRHERCRRNSNARDPGVIKRFDDGVPLLQYSDVRGEVGEKLEATKQIRGIKSKSAYFKLIFYPDFDINDSRNHKGWGRLSYLKGMKLIKDIFQRTPDVCDKFQAKLEKIFINYCHCLPLHWKSMYLGHSKGKCVWVGFDKEGIPLDMTKTVNKQRSGWCSKQEWVKSRITEDEAYDLPLSDALSVEILERAGTEGCIDFDNRKCERYINLGRTVRIELDHIDEQDAPFQDVIPYLLISN
jgi:hypothetical protein